MYVIYDLPVPSVFWMAGPHAGFTQYFLRVPANYVMVLLKGLDTGSMSLARKTYSCLYLHVSTGPSLKTFWEAKHALDESPLTVTAP